MTDRSDDEPVQPDLNAMFSQLAQALEVQKMLIAHLAGYRQELEAAGFSPTASEAMSMDYHRYLWNTIS